MKSLLTPLAIIFLILPYVWMVFYEPKYKRSQLSEMSYEILTLMQKKDPSEKEMKRIYELMKILDSFEYGYCDFEDCN